jgi:iron complex transport system substrate-binding protein
LIVTQAQCDVCAIRHDDVVSATRTLPSLARTRVLPLLPHSLAEILDDVLKVGDATGERQAAETVYRDLTARVMRVSSKAAPIPVDDRPSAACIEWVEPLMLAGNWVPEIVELAGGRNLLARGGELSVYWPWEAVVAENPDVLVITPCGFDLPRSLREAERLTTLPGWSQLSAVQNRRVYVVDGNAYFNRSGPRIVDSLEILAHLFHPRLFPSPAACGWQAL